MPSSAPAEMKELIGHIRAAGFKVVRTGNGAHQKVLTKSGQVVTDENGPLILSGSPGDRRWKEMHVKRLMGAGVLKADPFKATPKASAAAANGGNGAAAAGGKKRHITDPDIQAARNKAIHDKAERARERTVKLRSRLEPIVAKLGGWSQGQTGVSITDFGEVVFHWATARGRGELPKVGKNGAKITAANAIAAAGMLKRPGHTLGDMWYPVFAVFVDDLERGTGSPPDPAKAADRYRGFYREWKGLSDGPTSPAPLPPAEPPQPAEDVAVLPVRGRPVFGPLSDVAAPRVALEAMYLMARASDGSDEKKLMEIAAQIAELELNR